MNGEPEQRTTELRCGHPRLTVTDSVMRVLPIEPCLFCERDRLRESNAALLALARQCASECGDCAGTRICPDGNGGDEHCTACDDIWAVIDKAEGRL